MFLVCLPCLCLLRDVQDLFYLHAPTDVLANFKDHGHQYCLGGFLTMLTYLQYYTAYWFVLEHLKEIFLKIEAVLWASRIKGKIISLVMFYVI
jgi:hypothetical protein